MKADDPEDAAATSDPWPSKPEFLKDRARAGATAVTLILELQRRIRHETQRRCN
jgi:hypothetical protein